MPQLSKPRAVIMDMDGTIVDSEGFAQSVWSKAGKNIGFDIPELLLLNMIGSSVAKTNSMFTEHFGPDFPLAELRKVKTEIELVSYGKGLLKEKLGAMKFLSYVKSLNLPLGLATSTDRLRAEKRLHEVQLGEYFDFMLFGDEVINQKPDPEIYLKVAEKLDVSILDCLVVEDSPSGVTAALAAKAQVIWIKDLAEISDELKKQVIIYDSLESVVGDFRRLFL